MRAHYFQHVPFEGLGNIEPWLRAAGYTISSTSFFNDGLLPDLSCVDFLVVMGGPMSVNDEDQFPWLTDEKRFIKRAITTGIPVLGICLGAQLIASAMGARVYPGTMTEIGWFPIHRVSSVTDAVFQFPAAMEVFHWHGETFDLPPGAVHMARSDGCENQAFQLGVSTIGLQFHLETTPSSAREIVAHCRSELIPSRFVQSEHEIIGASLDKYETINAVLGELLSFMTQSDA